MKRVTRFCACLLLLALLVPVSHALAKGGPDKTTIEGPGLVAPIEVTDPETLKLFGDTPSPMNSSRFVDLDRGSIAEPRAGQPYRINFSYKGGSREFWQYYALNYYPNPSGGRGHVHDFYVGGTGKWFRATAEGEAVMQRLLKDNGISPTSSGSVFATNVITWNPWIITLGVTLLNGVVTLWLLRRTRQTPT